MPTADARPQADGDPVRPHDHGRFPSFFAARVQGVVATVPV